MCRTTKIVFKTFSTLKKNYPNVQEAINKTKFELKNLTSDMYKKRWSMRLWKKVNILK